MTIRFLSPTAAAYDTSRIESDQTMMAEFYAQAAQAIDGEGRPVYVRDNGAGATTRYTWELIVPDGSSGSNALRWIDEHWEPQPAASGQGGAIYPYFVLTRTDDPAEVLPALTAFVADNRVEQAGMPWTVAAGSGRRGGLVMNETNGVQWDQITRVWPAGGPAPFWWSLIPAGGNSPDTWWTTYRTRNEDPTPIYAAWTDDATPSAAEFEAAGTVVHMTIPAYTGSDAAAHLSLWFPDGYEIQGAPVPTPSWWDAYEAGGRTYGSTDVAIGGTDGAYLTTEAINPATAVGMSYQVSSTDVLFPEVEEAQPHPDIVRDVVRIQNVRYDASTAQLVGDRPQTDAERLWPDGPWAWLRLHETPPAQGSTVAAGSATASLRSDRGGRSGGPAMFYGWTPTRGAIADFSTLRESDDLHGVIPRYKDPRAKLTIWVADSFLSGLHCFELLVGGDTATETCDTEPHDAPDGRSGRLFVSRNTTNVDTYADRNFRIVPSAG